MSVFVPYTKDFFAMFKSAILEVELDDGVSTTKQQTGEIKNKIKGNLVELNKVRKQPHRFSGKKMFLQTAVLKVAKGNFQSESLKNVFEEVRS